MTEQSTTPEDYTLTTEEVRRMVVSRLSSGCATGRSSSTAGCPLTMLRFVLRNLNDAHRSQNPNSGKRSTRTQTLANR